MLRNLKTRAVPPAPTFLRGQPVDEQGKNMVNLHTVIGDLNTRKSSTLRCLTGLGGGNATKRLDVALGPASIMKVWCRLSALQESYAPLTPSEFIQLIQAMNPIPTDVAITLRVTGTSPLLPSAINYLQAFLSHGWTIKKSRCLGQMPVDRSSTSLRVWLSPLYPIAHINQRT